MQVQVKSEGYEVIKCPKCGYLLNPQLGGLCSVCDRDELEKKYAEQRRQTEIKIQKERQEKRDNWHVDFEEEVTHQDVLFSPVWIAGTIRPQLLFELIQSDLSDGDIEDILRSYKEYDSENSRNYGIFRGSLWKMGLIKQFIIQWKNDDGDSYKDRSIELSKKAKLIKSIDDMVSYLFDFCSKHFPDLPKFCSENKIGVTEIGRQYSLLHGLKLSDKNEENRDIEAWATFLKNYCGGEK